MFTKFSFLYILKTYSVFSNFFQPNWKLLVDAREGDCCLKSLKEKQIILHSQQLPKKL